MKLELLTNLISNAQNLGSHEDMVTACLATMMENSPAFMKYFLKKTKIADKGISKDYFLDVGSLLSKKNYEFLSNDFKSSIVKPDIWLDFDKDIVKSKTDSLQVIIEAKIFGGTLTPSQKKLYKILKNEKKFKKVRVVLIDSVGRDAKTYCDGLFDICLTWRDVLRISRTILDVELSPAERFGLEPLLDLMEERITPEFDLDDYSGKNITEKRTKLLHDLLFSIRDRLGFSRRKHHIYPNQWTTGEKNSKAGYDTSKYLFLNSSESRRVRVLWMSKSDEVKVQFEIARKSGEWRGGEEFVLGFESSMWISEYSSLIEKALNYSEK